MGEQGVRDVVPPARGWQGRRIPHRPDPPPPTLTTVSCELGFEIDDRATLALQLAPAHGADPLVEESLIVELDGRALASTEISTDHRGRVHLVESAAGHLDIAYRAVAPRPVASPTPPSVADRLVYLRQSRYCPSDRLEGFGADEFGPVTDPSESAQRIADWIFERVAYELGSSGPLDTAIETLLGGHGVCRDFAHLCVALCRSVGIPARVASVYAPGLSPMDFHAVAEVAVTDRWLVLDATRLAPRQTLLRIATGRDAADTAFCSTVEGYAELTTAMIGASTDADLPFDDHVEPVSLP